MNAMVSEKELLLGGREESVPKAELGTILVIEDDPRMQKVLKADLRRGKRPIEVAVLLLHRSPTCFPITPPGCGGPRPHPSPDIGQGTLSNHEVDRGGDPGDCPERDH